MTRVGFRTEPRHRDRIMISGVYTTIVRAELTHLSIQFVEVAAGRRRGPIRVFVLSEKREHD